MKRRLAITGGIALLVLVLLTLGSWWLARRHRPPVSVEQTAGVQPVVIPGEVRLFFPGAGNRLHEERREIPAEAVGEERVRLLLEALFSGPETDNLFAALPTGIEVEVGGVFLDPDGTAFVDLTSTSARVDGIGSRAELLSVYSIVNSILVNEPSVTAVVLLWNGRQPLTLAGHVDTTRPLTLNRELMAETL